VLVPDDEWMTPAQVRELLQVSRRTLQRWRDEGTGPEYIRPSTRVIRYRRSAIEAWLREQERQQRSKATDA
jgi:predicted site-specific integrase-resolvase